MLATPNALLTQSEAVSGSVRWLFLVARWRDRLGPMMHQTAGLTDVVHHADILGDSRHGIVASSSSASGTCEADHIRDLQWAGAFRRCRVTAQSENRDDALVTVPNNAGGVPNPHK
jgi:hypothetical protein